MDRPIFLNLLKEKFKRHKIIALLGPRQCGKTTLAKAYSRTYETFSRQNYFDLEKPIDHQRLLDPYQNLKDLKGLIIIDEIQRAPDLFPVLRVLHDEFNDKQFLILGSASKDLIRQSSESLTGRIHYEEITPFSFYETHEWKQLWFYGGFPKAYLASSNDESFEWRQNYITTLLEQDIPNLGFRIPANHLRRFWMMLAQSHGQIFNANELANSLDLSAQSIRRYLDLLNDMLMVRILQPWHENIGKRQVKSPKCYIRDSGIFHTLIHIEQPETFAVTPKRGASFEGFIIEEIIRTLRVKNSECFFWRTHAGAELDLLIFYKNKKIGFEIKLTDRPSMTKSMHIAKEDLKLDHIFLVHSGEISWNIEDKVKALSIDDLKNLIHLIEVL